MGPHTAGDVELCTGWKSRFVRTEMHRFCTEVGVYDKTSLGILNTMEKAFAIFYQLSWVCEFRKLSLALFSL